MSEENVKLARQYYEALIAEGGGGITDATQHLRHPDMEIFDPLDFPDAGRYVGEAALRKLIDSYLEVGWDGQYRVQEILDAGEEVVVIWQVGVRTPHGGGLPLDIPRFGHVVLFEDGRVRRIRQYRTRAEALEAAGLSE
jgi:ketosteroid isomerase-like protein